MKNERARKQVLISLAIVLACVALALMTGTRRVSAATFTVTNLNDNGAGSLRDAINQANTMAGADTVNFQAGLTGTITLTSGQLPAITEDLTIIGPGIFSITVSGNHASRVFQVGSGVTAGISGLTISDGRVVDDAGAGIANNGTLTLTNTVISGNTAISDGSGGGIFNSGSLTVTNTTLSGNSAISGGGIANSRTMTVTNSTLSGNSATGGGGGIRSAGNFTITNSTISGNSAGEGGGIDTHRGVGNISFTTLSDNSNSFGIAGGIANDASTINIKNSIIANSTGGNCGGSPINPSGINFSTDGTCPGFTQVTPAQLKLGPLQDNGGPTQTHALMAGSVAIDAAPDCTDLSATPAPVTTDQRGKPRPTDGDGNGSALCDAGAFELQPCAMVTCPANITQSNDLNQCGAVVTYPAPTTSGDCFTVTCTPASGSLFAKGTTTVNCDASGTTANPDCTFTITVNDTQAPTIACPANVTAVAAQTCPISSIATVNFPAPTVSDNCPGVTSMCSPASGSVFPVGTTTVTCTATDTSGNTATCSFTVTVFSGCLQDDSNPANVVLFNAGTGEYRFCCGGTVFTGVGTALVKGCVVTIQHYPADRRVLIKFDGAVGAGTASLQSPPGTIQCTITDRNTRNNTCACQ